jgi:hypothetical protein
MDGYGTVHAEPEKPEWYERCPECGGDCFQVDDQDGLVTWECFGCHLQFQDQYDWAIDIPDDGYEDCPF